MARRVLVVEDDEGTRALLLQALKDEGFEPVGAPDGRQALAAVEEAHRAGSPPALVLLDLQMPVMDGAAFARAYRAQTDSPAPIVLLTAGRPTPEQLADIGAASFVAKPFDLDAFFGAVRETVNGATTMRILLIEDNDADARLVQEALRDEPGVHVEVAPDGPAGLQALDRAVRNGDPHALVFLDLNLPRLDGFTVLETLKASEEHRRMPVVVLTGSEDGSDVVRAYDRRANGYVVKARDVETLQARMRGTIRFWQLVRLPRRRGPQPHLPR